MAHIYMVIKTEQLYISFEIFSVILNLLLIAYEHIYKVIYKSYLQLTIGSVIRVYHRVVWFFTKIRDTYSTSFCSICTSQVLKQGINKTFYLFDKIKIPLHLDDTSPKCTYPAKDTTENGAEMLQKSALPKVKCKLKFNILIYSQKSGLLTYFEKRKRVLHKGFIPYFLNFTEVYLYFLFNLTLHLTYFFQSFCRFCQYARYITSNERLFKKLLF